MEKLADIIARGRCEWPEKLAVADVGCTLTYAELAEQVMRVAAWLGQQGIVPGDRVVLSLPNSVRYVVAFFGVQWAGAVTTPLDPALPESQRVAILERTGAKCVLTAESPWEAIFATPPKAQSSQREPQDLASLMFTTGTTGQPKGVMLTHRNVFAAIHNIVSFLRYGPEDREVITLPLSHNFGLGHVLCNLVSGGAVYLEPGLTRVGRVLKAIELFGATGFPTTPLGVALLLDRYRAVFIERAKGLRFMVVNSAPLPPERTAQLQDALPGVDIHVYYGLTEASRSTFISLTHEGPKRYASVGQPMADVRIDLDESGEILIHGPTVTPGYWQDAELTNAALPNGVLHTGDLGRFDDEGFLYIIGRADDIINLGGYKINPRDVERVLELYPGLSEAAVTGGDSLCAFYVASEELDSEVLFKHCRRYLPVHETPQRFQRVAAMPRTDSGKLKRRELHITGD
ncbi:class I adenylate-forming enzyme family protein [Cerasicoccus frondis]|uniref:class I adenylate-forming enzyme family protein n=1 Tax=Cerasicoccus frondis TaxID=490090 RepID=UPI002852AA89|nr:class I adenylate-forming enzyme family protein [Cerasicoccus frondis]